MTGVVAADLKLLEQGQITGYAAHVSSVDVDDEGVLQVLLLRGAFGSACSHRWGTDDGGRCSLALRGQGVLHFPDEGSFLVGGPGTVQG